MRVSPTRDHKHFNYSLTGQVLEEVMDAKYLGVTPSNDLEWSKHIAIMTNKANSKLLFLRRNLKGCPEKLKQTAYFSLVRSFMEYSATVGFYTKNTTVAKLRGCNVELQLRFVKSRYSRYSSVSDMLDVLGWTPLSQMSRRLDLFCSTKLLTVWHKCPSKASLSRRIRVLEENTTLNLDRLAIQLASMDSRFFLKLLVHGTGLLLLKLRHWLYLDQILFEISVHPFRIIP